VSSQESTQHKNVLARGLNFAIAPSVLPKEKFVIAIEKASRGMEPDEGDAFRNEVLSSLRSAKCPKPNLSRQELQALTDLKRNSDIMILPADKGRATVILDKVECDEKVRQMLSDEKTYEKLKRDPTPIYKKRSWWQFFPSSKTKAN